MHIRAPGPVRPAFPWGHAGIPSAVLSRIHANSDPAAFISQLTANFEQFKAKYSGDLTQLGATVDDLIIKMAALQMRPGEPAASVSTIPADPEYTRTFASFMRSGDSEMALKAMQAANGRAAIRAAMSEGTPNAGGYLAPTEWDRKVVSSLKTVSPFRQLATIRQTSTQAFSTVWNGGGWGSGWVGETAARPNTATPSLGSIVFPAGQLYADPAITQDLLDDADFDLQGWLSDELTAEFAKQEAIAFISGDGVNKPQGLLTYITGGSAASVHPGGVLGVTTTGAASTVTGDGFVDMVYGLAAPYRTNARWLMNSATTGKVSKLKDGQGNYLWNKSYVVGQPDTLLGYPVAIDENMPDVAANAYPVAFGDFARGYLINDRLGITVLRDPYTNKPYVNFYTRKRVGGGVLDPKAIRLLQVAAP